MAKTTARIEITAVNKTKAALSGVTKDLKQVALAATAVGVAAGAALTVLVKDSLKVGDALGKTADKIGTTTEALQGLRLAAERTAGVSNKVLDTALQRLSRRSSEAAQGTGTLLKELDRLGIDAQEFNLLSVDQQFAQLGDAMEGVTNQGDRLRISMAAFDTEGAALEATLAGGTASLQAFNRQADEMGLALSRVDVANIEAANDAIGDIEKSTEGMGLQITAALAPALTVASQGILTLSADTEFWADSTEKAVKFAIDGLFAVAKAASALGFVWSAVGAKAVGAIRAPITAFLELQAALPGVGKALANVLGGPLWGSFFQSTANVQIVADALLAKQIEMEEAATTHVERIEELGERQKGVYEAVAAAAVAGAETQIAALESVATKTDKHTQQRIKLEKALTGAQKKEEKNKLAATQGFTTAAINLGNTLFEDNKAVRAGLIVADTARGIMMAMATAPSFPVGLAQSAVVASMGVAQLASARGAAKGGGSVSPVSGGGGGAAAAGPSPVLQDEAAPAGSTTTVNIGLQGGLFNREQVRELIEQINSEIGDGAELVAV